MCGCLVIGISFLSPRLAMVIAWIFTDWVDQAYGTFIIPLLGLIFLPWTALLWTLAYAIADEVNVLSIFAIVIGLIADISSYAGGAYSGRQYVSQS